MAGRRYKIYRLSRLIEERLGNGSPDLVTRKIGSKLRGILERGLFAEDEGRIVILDFSQVGIIDYSCADEVVAKLMGRLISNEYGDKYILLRNLAANQKENIRVALERKGLAALLVGNNNGLEVLGILNPYLWDTLKEIKRRKEITARELRELTRAEINSACMKLLNLYKLRLVIRVRDSINHHRGYVYKPLL